MGQLHELLAVESDLKATAEAILAETKKVFNKPTMFTGHVKTLTMSDDERKFEEDAGRDEKNITTTVSERLEYTAKMVGRYFTALLEKEVTNQNAMANLEVDGEVLAENLPATFLLAMESRLKAIRSVVILMPTLASGVEWEIDMLKAAGVYRTSTPTVTNKTEKVVVPQILYEATKEHPAQVEKLNRDVVVGKFTTTEWSGMATSAYKHKVLERLDKLIRAVKKARMKANKEEVIQCIDAGKVMLDYVFGL